MTSRETFGSELRRQRERRGITLESIEGTTKISRSLLVALERGDLSRWPGGLYRRSFLRDYGAAIGLPSESLLREYTRLFPEPGQPPGDGPPPDGESAFRLGMLPEPRWRGLARRAATAAIDLGAVGVLGYGVSLTGVNLWMSIAATGAVYHAVNTMYLGQSFASWCLSPTSPFRRLPSAARAGDSLPTRDWLSQVLGAPAFADIPHPSPDSSLEPSA
jgi:transcriptional regulator with XRE-family HTH domain